MKRFAVILIALIMMSCYAFSDNRQYAIYDAATGEKIDMKAFAERSKGYDIIFFGEFHDDTIIHKLQDEYLKAMFDVNTKLAVSFEMFERDAQEYVDNYLSGKINEEEFLKNSHPWPDYNIFYKPLLELAKSHNAPVIAANIPRMFAGMYTGMGMSGIEKLPPKSRAYVTRTLTIDDDEYMHNFYKTMLMNFGMDSNAVLKPNQENTMYLYYGAQLIKDETMAESMVDFLKAHEGFKIVHFNGDFHSNSYFGTVKKVMQRDKNLKLGVITPTYVETGKPVDFDKSFTGKCNFLIVLEEKKEKQEFTQQMMGGHMNENYIVSHKINIKLDPTNHTLKGNDVFKFRNPILHKSSVKMLKDLKIENVKAIDGEVEYSVVPVEGDSLYQEIIFSEKGKEISEIDMSYQGTVYHSPNVTLLTQRHSNTPGIISNAKDEGIYLPGGSYFPQADKDLASFNISVSVPKDLTIITSGTLDTVITEGDISTFKYKSEINAEEFILVGGKYNSIDSIYDGKKFVVYTFSNTGTAKTYLNASIDYYILYTKLLGLYPYSSFKVVENFFATGFGMPGYTLLSNRLMAMPWILLMPGSLAHEFCHNWWGNSVFVDYNSGNWCEALTTYSANYYYNVLMNKPNDALDWRKKSLISISTLPEKANYPVIKFKYQAVYDDATIGYNKGGFIFYEMMKIMGEEKFFAALRSFGQKYKGKRTTWNSIIGSFEDQYKGDSIKPPIKNTMNQWLNSTVVPTLKLKRFEAVKDSVRLTITQDSAFYMSVPVEFVTDKGKVIQYFTIKDKENIFTTKVEGRLKSVQVDPYYQALRKLYKWEIPYSFNITLNDNPLLILPSKKSDDYKVAEQFAQMIIESSYKIDFKSIDELKDEDWANRSIIVLGDDKTNSFYKNLKGKLPEGVNLDGNNMTVKDKKLTADAQLLMFHYAQPKNADKYMTVIYSNKIDSQEPLKRLFRYLSYSLVALNKAKVGMPQAQMEIFPDVKDKSEMMIKFEK